MAPKLSPAVSLLAPKIDLGAQGDFWMHLGRLLAPFWHPLGSTCHPVGFDWLPFGVLLLPSRLILDPFGALGITLPAVEPHFVSISDFGGTNLHQNVISGA